MVSYIPDSLRKICKYFHPPRIKNGRFGGSEQQTIRTDVNYTINTLHNSAEKMKPK